MQGVYTKNRNFRLYLSTKIGKNAPLVASSVSGMNPPDPSLAVTEKAHEKFFLASLVTVGVYKEGMKILNVGPDKTSFKSDSYLRHRSVSSSLSRTGDALPTMFPDIQSFMIKYISRTGSPAFIRNATYFSTSQTLILGVNGNRYCHRIQREHKSNGVYYIVDIKRGLFCQKCFDPDCLYWRSPETSLPVLLIPFIHDANINNQDDFEDTYDDYIPLDVWDELENQVFGHANKQ